MTIKAPTKKELQFLKLLLSGKSTRGSARQLKIPERSAYNMAEKLTYLGFIRPIPGTRSPVIYEKGDLDYSFIEGRCKLGQGATKGAPSPIREFHQAPDPVRGVSTEKECPEGFVEAHVNGSMSFTIVRTGSFDDPQIPGIGYVGFWRRKEVILNGSVNRYGSININGQDVGITYRKGSRGSETFSFAPKRIFLDPKEFRSEEEAKELFIDRALKVATILKNTGWVLTDPKFDGNSTFEYAIRNSPLVQFLEKGHEKDNDIIMDGSPGCPEIEMTNPDCWDKVQIFANLPTHVMEAKAQASIAMTAAVQVRSGCAGAIARLDAIDQVLGRIIDVQDRTAQAILNNTENLVNLARGNYADNPPYTPQPLGRMSPEGYQ